MCLSVCLLICLCACHYFVCLPLCLPRCPECHKVWQDILGRRWVGVKCLLKCVSLYRVGGMAISLDHCLRRRRHSCRRCYSVLAFAINFHDTSYWWWRLMICPATIIARLLRHLCAFISMELFESPICLKYVFRFIRPLWEQRLRFFVLLHLTWWRLLIVSFSAL